MKRPGPLTSFFLGLFAASVAFSVAGRAQSAHQFGNDLPIYVPCLLNELQSPQKCQPKLLLAKSDPISTPSPAPMCGNSFTPANVVLKGWKKLVGDIPSRIALFKHKLYPFFIPVNITAAVVGASVGDEVNSEGHSTTVAARSSPRVDPPAKDTRWVEVQFTSCVAADDGNYQLIEHLKFPTPKDYDSVRATVDVNPIP